MAEFLTMQEAEDKFGKKGKTNAALTLGIIGTALGCSNLTKLMLKDIQTTAAASQRNNY